ncbi:PREDICTED: uncharacterized protein LOC109341770 isoform X2 [Lupinus angustifolius]|uniref:uncharacterized protein LOC109341770 isoform X2 n=1 Tax=Lupinus angustifolius TaxID=3871 RepID=UPI00092EED59|nr:PREDICTED: uncharacterized protein LOC109341770 isoform X2 [Lupinus angustifolius]
MTTCKLFCGISPCPVILVCPFFVLVLLLGFVRGMDDFGSSYGWNGCGWQQIPPGPSNINEINGSNSNVIPIGEGGVSNPFMGDVANDPVQRRQYSETYRRKKQEQVQHLEHLEKSLNVSLSDNTPQLGYHRGMESHYDAEGSSLAQTYYTMNSNYQYVEADIDIYATQLKDQKLMHEVYEALKPEMKKYQDK